MVGVLLDPGSEWILGAPILGFDPADPRDHMAQDERPDPAEPAPRASAPRRRPTRTPGQWISRAMFYGHLWVGVIVTVLTLAVSITGILLNHKRPLGLMPDVEHEASSPFEQALPLAELARLAEGATGPEISAAGVDRMDVRPRDGLVKVRFDDPALTEVIVDLGSGEILNVGRRADTFVEWLHSGEAFGDRWILLSDATAVGLILLVLSGYWLWLYPRWRRT